MLSIIFPANLYLLMMKRKRRGGGAECHLDERCIYTCTYIRSRHGGSRVRRRSQPGWSGQRPPRVSPGVQGWGRQTGPLRAVWPRSQTTASAAGRSARRPRRSSPRGRSPGELGVKGQAAPGAHQRPPVQFVCISLN